MFELIEDNKNLLLILLVLVFLISSIYIKINTSTKTKNSKIFQKYQNIIDDISKNNLAQNRYKQRINQQEHEQEYEQESEQESEQEQEYIQALSTYNKSQQQEVNNYQDNISKNYIENLIKNVKTVKKTEPVLKKIDNHTNTIGDNKLLDTNLILESTKNFNRISDLIQFKMNPTQNISPNIENNISMIKTGCNKTPESQLSGFNGIF